MMNGAESNKTELDKIVPILFQTARDIADGWGQKSPSEDEFHARIEGRDITLTFYPKFDIHSPVPKTVESVVIRSPGIRLILDYDGKIYSVPRYKLPTEYKGGIERFASEVYQILENYVSQQKQKLRTEAIV